MSARLLQSKPSGGEHLAFWVCHTVCVCVFGVRVVAFMVQCLRLMLYIT